MNTETGHVGKGTARMAMVTSPRTGRRPGDSGARDAILAASQTVFAERGYDRATIRAIAGSAGVDPALVHYYFDTKANLFQAAISRALAGDVVRPALVTGDVASAGARVAQLFFRAWEPAGRRRTFAALLRSAITSRRAMQLLRQAMRQELVEPVEALGLPDAGLRATLVASQLIGLALTRYLLDLEPLTSADSRVLTAAIAPTLQRYLTGPSGLSGAT